MLCCLLRPRTIRKIPIAQRDRLQNAQPRSRSRAGCSAVLKPLSSRPSRPCLCFHSPLRRASLTLTGKLNRTRKRGGPCMTRRYKPDDPDLKDIPYETSPRIEIELDPGLPPLDAGLIKGPFRCYEREIEDEAGNKRIALDVSLLPRQYLKEHWLSKWTFPHVELDDENLPLLFWRKSTFPPALKPMPASTTRLAPASSGAPVSRAMSPIS